LQFVQIIHSKQININLIFDKFERLIHFIFSIQKKKKNVVTKIDWALSFQEVAGCEAVWLKLKEFQKQLQDRDFVVKNKN